MSARGRPDAGFGHYLREVVYGANDGVVTTLAVVAGVEGADLPPLVAVVLGLANLLADGVSMGASGYLALKSELEQTGRSVAEERPLFHGAATTGAFIAVGAAPLLAFLLPLPPGRATFFAAIALGGVAVATVGGARSRWTGRGRLASAAEMLAVAGLAVAVAYGVGVGLRALLA